MRKAAMRDSSQKKSAKTSPSAKNRRSAHVTRPSRRKEENKGVPAKGRRLRGTDGSRSVAHANLVSGGGKRDEMFPIVGVGASAGGLEALTLLLRALPADTGMGFVIVQHLDPKHESMLTEILSAATTMPAMEVKDGMRVEADHVYVIPPNTNMALLRGRLNLMPRPEFVGHLPIDYFLRSLSDDQEGRAIGVILSGTASDGTHGLAAIKGGGGITFAQDPKTAKYDGMPRSAIAAGVVDLILSPEEIAHELIKIGRHPYVAPGLFKRAEELLPGPEDALSKVFVLLRDTHAVDFTDYKPSTIKRRIIRRMVLHKIDRLDEYIKYLQRNPAEVDSLYQDILITVTSFFRDPHTFEALNQRVFPEVLKHRGPDSAIRVWVPGCATGEEAYSVAMAWLEFLDETASGTRLQIFATDISDRSIERARSGAYPESIRADVSAERLRRFFVNVDGSYQISKTIRDMCVFARHNVARDAPFSKVDLVCFRNVLIYMGPMLQKKVMPILHYALNRSGFLMLGNSETIGSFADLFSLVDGKHKIYAKKEAFSGTGVDFAARDHGAEGKDFRKPVRKPGEADWGHFDLQKETDRIVLGRYAPAAVTINENLDILQFRGHMSPYFEPMPGVASLNLLKMIREDLLLEVRTAVHEAKKKDANARRTNLQVPYDGQTKTFNLEVIPIRSPFVKERFFLVLFEEATLLATPPTGPAGHYKAETDKAETGAGSKRRNLEKEIARLGRELEAIQAYLHATIEDHEATNEELRAANEEITSSNEELQSTNEELETAKEELQSTNEELNTVNEELQNRNLALNRLNNDLRNLLTGLNMPIVVLGQDLCIRRFTASAERAFNLIPSDVGRPITDIKPNIDADLERLALEVADSPGAIEREVQDRQGLWYSMRIRPYLTDDNKVDGAVMSLVDIDALKSSRQELRECRDFIDTMLAAAAPLVALDAELRVRATSRSFCQAFRLKPEESVGCPIYELDGGKWNIPKLRNLLSALTRDNPLVRDFEIVHDFGEPGRKRLLMDAQRVDDEGRHTHFVFLNIREIAAQDPPEEQARAG